jgi:hypothetical protein
VAAPCLRPCRVIGGRPARAASVSNLVLIQAGRSGVPSSLVNTRPGSVHSPAPPCSTSPAPLCTPTAFRVDQGMFLRKEFKATGIDDLGAVRLAGARIGGELDCARANMLNYAGTALRADNLQVGQSMFLTDQFTATGRGDRGAVRLPGAHIGSNLECTEATLRNKSGPALLADRLQVDQVMFLRGEFTGSGSRGAVRLVGAHIGGQLECTGATVVNDTGTALNADNLQVDQDVYLGGGFAATGGGDGVAVDLTSARLGGRLVFDPVPQLEHATDPQARLAVNGLAYRDVPAGISAREWLWLLRKGTRRYAAQPYQQLAAIHRADGHDGDVRRVLMSQRRDQLTDPSTSRLERAWGRLTRLTLGYGYQPWRALLFLLAVVGIAVTLTVTVGPHGGLGRTIHPRSPQPPVARQSNVSASAWTSASH